MSTKYLESAALEAHRNGERFSQFYRRHEAAIREAVGHNRQQFAKLYHRLLMLVIAGDTDGMEPVGEGLPLFDVVEPCGRPTISPTT